MTRLTQTDDGSALTEFEASARAEVVLPVDAHVIGEPVTVTRIRYPALSRAGRRRDRARQVRPRGVVPGGRSRTPATGLADACDGTRRRRR